MKIETVSGGCSSKLKPVGFQFTVAGSDYYVNGSFSIMPGGSYTPAEKLVGRFLYGQSFPARGCKHCGSRFIYQCGICDSFVCYSGLRTENATCPVCGEKSTIPATTDSRIVRSSAAPKIEILLAMDISASMDERTGSGKTRLEEAKNSAISDFIRAFPDAKMGLVAFGTTVRTVLGFTEDESAVESAVRGLRTDGGTTSPFHHIRENFDAFLRETASAKRFIVIFTDGAWAGRRDGHIATATKMRKSGVEIITIGCADADMAFLSEIASSGANIEVRGEDFGTAYATAAEKIRQ